MDRLYASAQVYQLDIPLLAEELNEVICETIRRNDFKNCYIRPTAYLTAAAWAFARLSGRIQHPDLGMANDFGAEKLSEGMRVTVSPYKNSIQA